MNLWNETKSISISKAMIWQVYLKVRANKGSADIDNISMKQFDANRSKNLCEIWNRITSGCFFSPAVKQV